MLLRDIVFKILKNLGQVLLQLEVFRKKLIFRIVSNFLEYLLFELLRRIKINLTPLRQAVTVLSYCFCSDRMRSENFLESL